MPRKPKPTKTEQVLLRQIELIDAQIAVTRKQIDEMTSHIGGLLDSRTILSNELRRLATERGHT